MTDLVQCTPLNAVHRELGAKMTEFGGWDMPLHYGDIIGEYTSVRARVGLFDTSHMRAFCVSGAEANAYLQFITPRKVGTVSGKVQYAVLTNKAGGAVDDCTIYCASPEAYLVVVNAGNIEKDFAWMKGHASGFDVEIEKETHYCGILALQGPLAEKVLAKCVDEVASIPKGRYTFAQSTISGCTVILSRTGYTGEDGFEILCVPAFLSHYWSMMLERGAPEGILPCGLGARDLLRLEAWMPLYGHELTEKRGPLEANLHRVVNLDKREFSIGRNALTLKLLSGPLETLIGLKTSERGVIMRPGTLIGIDDRVIGEVTSGSPYPSGISLGMGFVSRDIDPTPGMTLQVQIHKKWRNALVVERKFVPTPKESS